ncbi:MAG TPA: SDR family oxidoreductase [Aggregatilineales bacterium]|nr:SDR family oxidoreductase [Aggregatilineales bacterium]
MELQDKVALVTGGARRVGRAIALGLARRGMDVLVHYNRSEADAAQTVESLRALGVRTSAVQADLGSPASIEQVFAALGREFGRLDVLVNSASTFVTGGILDMPVEAWDDVMAVNLRAPFLCSQHAARLMLAQGTGGVIVNIADVAGQLPWTRFPAHSVSKAGLIMLTKVLAKSLGPQIRVNAVVPGPVLKPGAMPDARWAELGAALPVGRPGEPDNVVQAVLATIDNDFMTGSVLNVDGGDSLLGSIDLAGPPPG